MEMLMDYNKSHVFVILMDRFTRKFNAIAEQLLRHDLDITGMSYLTKCKLHMSVYAYYILSLSESAKLWSIKFILLDILQRKLEAFCV